MHGLFQVVVRSVQDAMQQEECLVIIHVKYDFMKKYRVSITIVKEISRVFYAKNERDAESKAKKKYRGRTMTIGKKDITDQHVNAFSY